MPRRSRSSSISHALSRILHATEDLMDDALDRAGDVEHGMRRSFSRALDDDRDDRDHRHRRGSRRPGDDRDYDWDYDRDDRDHDHWRRDEDRRGDDRPSGRERRGADEFRALKDQLSQLANRIYRISGG